MQSTKIGIYIGCNLPRLVFYCLKCGLPRFVFVWDAVYQDLKALERFVLEAANEYGYDGTDEFSRDFRKSFSSFLKNLFQCLQML